MSRDGITGGFAGTVHHMESARANFILLRTTKLRCAHITATPRLAQAGSLCVVPDKPGYKTRPGSEAGSKPFQNARAYNKKCGPFHAVIGLAGGSLVGNPVRAER